MSAAEIFVAWAATLAVLAAVVWVMVQILHALTH